MTLGRKLPILIGLSDGEASNLGSTGHHFPGIRERQTDRRQTEGQGSDNTDSLAYLFISYTVYKHPYVLN